jgi:hypothetical protein
LAKALRAGCLVRYTTPDDIVRELRQPDQLGALRQNSPTTSARTP